METCICQYLGHRRKGYPVKQRVYSIHVNTDLLSRSVFLQENGVRRIGPLIRSVVKQDGEEIVYVQVLLNLSPL